MRECAGAKTDLTTKDEKNEKITKGPLYADPADRWRLRGMSARRHERLNHQEAKEPSWFWADVFERDCSWLLRSLAVWFTDKDLQPIVLALMVVGYHPPYGYGLAGQRVMGRGFSAV
jgi:hypothetical protein